MQVKCEFCENYIDETIMQCPYCGAPNNRANRSASGIPRTIEELKEFALKKGLPLEKMRFFIGEDCREPRAFGIYKEPNDVVVVYKNKSDGSRVVRYRGTDEAYGVNELYQKMRSEIQTRKSGSASKGIKRNSQPVGVDRGCLKYILYFVGFVVLCIFLFGDSDSGYYQYNNQYYYCDNYDDWYVYDDGWQPTSIDDELQDNTDTYYEGSEYSDEYNIQDFVDSEYYTVTDSSDWEDDWDDDDWDWDDDTDWDSSDTDWDSDW